MNTNTLSRQLVLALGALTLPVQAATFLVTSTDDGSDGLCDDHCTLREAVEAANAAPGEDTVDAAGISGSIQLGSEIFISEDLILQGPGSGALDLIAAADSRVLRTPNTVLDGVALRLQLSGFSMQGGDVSSSELPYGGALFADEAIIDDLVVRGGKAEIGGGLMLVGDASLSDVEISDASATYSGSAIFANASLSMARGRVHSNTLPVRGSTIDAFAGSARIIDSTIADNVGTGVGGAHLQISGSTISGNTTVENGYEGAAGVFNSGDLIMRNSTVSGNSALGQVGGGVYSQHSATIIASTITNNMMDCGGLSFCHGAGVFAESGLTLVGSIVANSQGASDCGILGADFNGRVVSATDSLSTDDSCGDALQVTASELALDVLADNGGPTQTHALLPGSLAIDAVADCGDVTTDQRGVSRPYNGACDVGAFEFVHHTVTLSTEGLITASAGLLNARFDLSYSAYIVDENTGLPLAGKTVYFDSGNTTACEAVSDDSGLASCGASVGGLLATLLGNGYTARFDGDAAYAPANANGMLLSLN